jgi:predicted metalloprotease with PDZ domain
MPRTPLIAGLLLLLATLAAWQLWPRTPSPWDGQPNRYTVRIAEGGSHAEVEASIWQGSDMLSMFDVSPVEGLPNGHVDLVEDLQVRAADGSTQGLRDLGYGDFAVAGGQRLSLRYRVRLEHDRHPWPAGTEEVAYRTDEGLLFRVSTLLFADGGERMEGPFEVDFDLPAGWAAHTPWEPVDGDLRFRPASRRELLNNVVFLGRAHAERIEAGGVAMTLVLGRRYVAQIDLFRELLDTQMRRYQAMFGGNPLGQRYLIVINDGASGDGGAFASSFSQFVPGDASVANRVVWGHTMAHELLHFWNGLSLVPADHREEWFKEGVTDYLTIATMAQSGLIDRELLHKRLENLPRRWVLARHLQRLPMTVREAGADKQPNRLLVYGGGALAALALDAELRQRSGDRVGLPQLMAALYAEFGKPGARYTLDDVVRHADALTGSDFAPFLARAVESSAGIDDAAALAAFGLRIDRFVDEIYISPAGDADPAQRARFAAAFGPSTP